VYERGWLEPHIRMLGGRPLAGRMHSDRGHIGTGGSMMADLTRTQKQGPLDASVPCGG